MDATREELLVELEKERQRSIAFGSRCVEYRHALEQISTMVHARASYDMRRIAKAALKMKS